MLCVQPEWARGYGVIKISSVQFQNLILRDVAQLVARLLWEQDVAGSNPVIPTKNPVQALAVWIGFFLG